MKALLFLRRPATLAKLLIATVFVASCGDNPAAPPKGAGDPENISRVTVTLTPVGGGAAVTSFVVDPDGTQLIQPPQPPSATLALTKGVTYNGTITLLNDIDVHNVINISNEVRNEANFHRFFYTITADTINGRSNINLPPSDATTLITINNLDTDTQNPPQPLGLTYTVVVDPAAPNGNTTLNIQLHHFEQAKGDGLGTTFDTDLELNFPVSVN
jgi:hypothetical protein